MFSQPSRELVLKKLGDRFPDPAKAEEALAILDRYGTEEWEQEKDRVQLAVLKLSEGDIEKLRLHLRRAKEDFRDALVPAESPESWMPPFDRPAAERAAIRERDRAQYEAWLSSNE